MAKQKEKKELKQTKNAFKVIGKVSRIDKDGAFRQEEMSKGKRKGDTYRALRFGVKTSETNEITVEMFDYEPEQVFLWNSDKKKKDPNYKGDRLDFAKWEKNQDKLREQGYAVLQTRVGLEYGEDGKLISQGLPSFVASEEIFNGLNNGDSVVVEGEIRYSKFKNQQDKEVERKSFVIKKAIKLKNDIDWEDAKFEEVTYFEQEMVFIGADHEQKDKKVFVTGRVIDFAKNFHDTQFVIDYSDGEDGVDAGMKKLADAFLKKFAFGDVLNVFGNTVNRVLVEEVESDEEDSDDDLLSQLGGKSKPQHAQSYQNKTYISEMQIEGVDAWDKKVYKEEDFETEELVVDGDEDADGEDLQDELGGKKNNKGKNPFSADVDDDDIDDDDLPF